MDKFTALPKDRQMHVINAAITAFGKNGYKKTFVNDIAVSAGISKALLFHYFKSKKNLYLFLFDYSATQILNEIKEKLDKRETDFFGRISLMEEIKFGLIYSYPNLFDFLKSAHFEDDKEVKAEVKQMYLSSFNSDLKAVFKGTDYSKFKVNIDPKMIMQIITWCSEGMVSDYQKTKDIDALRKEFNKYLTLFRLNFYKEECL